MTVCVFPGQGVQRKGMGGTLFDEFKELLEPVDDILGYSLKELCLEDSKSLLNNTQFAQPAIYVVNALYYFKRVRENSKKPDYLAGHSLGEYNALLAGEAFDFVTGLKLVQQRAFLMSQADDGAMIAVIGLSYEQINAVLHDQQFADVCIANYNTPSQFVLSGSRINIEKLQDIFKGMNGVLCIVLKTSGPFHSPFMEEAKEQFKSYLNQFEFYEPSLPVISNVNARPYRLTELNNLLANQITHPVLWTKSIQYLLAKGEDSFEEIGESTVLNGLINQIKEQTKCDDLNLPASRYSKIFWFAALRLPPEEQCRYHLYGMFHYSEKPDVSRLESALQMLVNTNYNLRTTFVTHHDELQQVISDEKIVDLLCYSVNSKEQYEEILHNTINEPFDLAQGPLFRFVLIENNKTGKTTFLPVFHHIIIDGTQFDALMKRISDYYRSPINLHLTDKAEIELLKDYLTTEKKLIEKANPEFWVDKLNKYPLHINLPKQYGLVDRSFKEIHQLYELEQGLYERLKLFSHDSGYSLFQILKTVWAVLISEYTNQKQLVISFPINTRGKKYSALKGAFVNNLFYCFEKTGTFREYLKQEKEEIRSREHWYVSTFDIMSSLQGKEHDFSVAFSQSDLLINGPVLNADPQSTFAVGIVGAKLYFLYQDMGDRLNYGLVGLEELFDKTFLEQIHRHIEVLISTILDDPDIELKKISCLGTAEYNKIIHTWNQTEFAISPDINLHTLFIEQAKKTPDAIAVSDAYQSLTYQQLDEKSTLLANFLLNKGIVAGSKVAVCINRSVDLVICLLAVIKSKAAYVPLDPEYPAERLDYMLEDSGCSLILSQSMLQDKLSFLTSKAIELIFIDTDWAKSTVEQEDLLEGTIKPPDLAYMIYTSGSTGRPKGVMVTHRGLVNLLLHMKNKLGLRENDKLLAITTYCFDIAALELFLPLIVGAECHVCSSEVASDAELLKKDIAELKPTLMQATPITWSMLLHIGWNNPERVTIVCGGEALPESLKDQLVATGCTVWNVYGPTETTIWSTMQRMEKGKLVTIGKPIANTKIYILDEDLNPCPIGISGELYISGDGVAQGYHRNPQLTAERFINNPFLKGEKMYKTGDLGQWLSNGEIAYIGRCDQQVKIRGFRIELGEIEKSLNRHPDVKQAVVLVDGQGVMKRLIVYYVMQSEKTVDLRQLRLFLKSSLPDYMIPQEFIELAQFPLTPNGKIDKKKLIGCEKKSSLTASSTGPCDLEHVVINIFKTILSKEDIDLDDHFFDIGGDSFKALIVVEQINKQLSTTIQVTQLFRHARIKDFCNYLKTVIPQESANASAGKITFSAQSSDLQDTKEFPEDYQNSVAIIGISCQVPGAENHYQFWENLKNGRDSIQFHSLNEAQSLGLTEDKLKHPHYVPQHASIDDKDKFDPSFFNISPRDAELMDPQARLLLIHAWKAIEDAGYLVSDISDTSVFISVSNNFYQGLLPNFVAHMTQTRILDNANEYVAWLHAQSGTIPTIISNKLDLNGPSLAVNTNCSSSLVGINLAFQSLLSGEVRHALVGAATLFPAESLGYVYQPGLNFSSDGRCKTFDASADGMVGGEGVAVVLLKRAIDAIKDGDHIYALIRGVSVNNDGANKVGFYAPSAQGQARVIQKVLEQTQINPETICYVEAHGTGTKIGDPIEFTALTEVYQKYTHKKNFCGIGSVKSNIGHLDTAAGLAGLIKTALILYHEAIPQTLHYTQPNPEMDVDNSPFYIVNKYGSLPARTIPYRAAVSAFGIGGTNAHAILEQYSDPAKFNVKEHNEKPFLIVLSAKDEERLKVYVKSLLDFLSAYPKSPPDLSDLAYTLQVGRKAMRCRIAFLVNDHTSLKEILTYYLTHNALPLSSQTKHEKLQQIADRWINGETIDWQQLIGEPKPRRISLPTYPFAKKRYWIEAASSKQVDHEKTVLKTEDRKLSMLSIERQVCGAIVHQIAQSLKLDIAEIQLDKSFADYGLDSLVGVNLVHQLNESLKINLHVTSLFDYPTVNQLKKHILNCFGEQLHTQTIVNASPPNTNITSTISDAEQQSPIKNYSDKGKEPIAIIGMSARFPQAADVDELWQHLSKGHDLIEKVTRWDLTPYDIKCKQGGFLRDISTFDPLFFNISGFEASYMEPQQRIFLEESWKALEDAGYAGKAIENLQTGVYVGCCAGDYLNLMDNNYPAQAFWGNMNSLVPARVSYYLNLHGPAIAVDTACSSSLVAIHLACQALWHREIDLALAGGIFIQCTPRLYIAANRAGMLSPNGRCYTFDDRADGFVPSEGAGVLVLKRLSAALADGDHIHGIIRGSGVNQDGTTNGITAPSANSQERLIQQVYEDYNIDPATIQLVEAHGTGTKLGDPIEFQALCRAFGKYTDKRQFCALGSIKTNIGHAQLAAGVAGMIKILLALKNKKISPSLNYQTPNSNIEFKNSPFYINTDLKDWHVEFNEKRIAATSSFGASGTNAHLVIEEAPEVALSIQMEKPYLIVLSAHTEEQLFQQMQRLAHYCHKNPDVDLGSVSYTLFMGRKHFRHRFACIVQNINELQVALSDWPAQKKEILSDKGDLYSLAQQFLDGETIEVESLFQGKPYLKISLPTYPFGKERYWLTQSKLSEGNSNTQSQTVNETITLQPKWEAWTSETSPLWPLSNERIVIVGGTANMQAAIKARYSSAIILDMNANVSMESIQEKLQSLQIIDHLIWIEPPALAKQNFAEELIQGQYTGPIFVFRILKSLLALNYSQRCFGWTFITYKTQAVYPNEQVNATYSSLHGMVGSIAKEYPNWRIRMVDLDENTEENLTQVFHIPADCDGNALFCRKGQWFKQKLSVLSQVTAKNSPFKHGGVYIIIGGAGGIGEAISDYLIRNYQAQIVWIGRTLKNETIQNKINQWAHIGPLPYYISADATDLQHMELAYREIKELFGSVNGIFQAALVFARASLDVMDESHFHQVLKAKVDVSVRMLQVFQNEPLDFMVFISSINSFLKALGQSHYAAACTFKDALALQLAQQCSYPIKVINLGYCFNNMAENTAAERLKYIQPNEIMMTLENLIAGDIHQIALMKQSIDFNSRGICIIPNASDAHTDKPMKQDDADLAQIKERMHALNELLLERME